MAQRRSFPAKQLEQRFGRRGRRLHELADGIALAPVRASRLAK